MLENHLGNDGNFLQTCDNSAAEPLMHNNESSIFDIKLQQMSFLSKGHEYDTYQDVM